MKRNFYKFTKQFSLQRHPWWNPKDQTQAIQCQSLLSLRQLLATSSRGYMDTKINTVIHLSSDINNINCNTYLVERVRWENLAGPKALAKTKTAANTVNEKIIFPFSLYSVRFWQSSSIQYSFRQMVLFLLLCFAFVLEKERFPTECICTSDLA